MVPSAPRILYVYPDSKVHGATMGLTWVLSVPDGPHVPWYQGIHPGTDIQGSFSTDHSDLSVQQSLTYCHQGMNGKSNAAIYREELLLWYRMVLVALYILYVCNDPSTALQESVPTGQLDF